MTFKNELLSNGVVLVKNAWKKEDISTISKDYDQLDATLTNKDIVKEKPIIVFWKHVIGEQKRICTFDEFPSLWKFINSKIVPKVKEILEDDNAYLQLLETIIFNKPYETSNTLHWHQDVAYFPLKPNNQIAVCVLHPSHSLPSLTNRIMESRRRGSLFQEPKRSEPPTIKHSR